MMRDGAFPWELRSCVNPECDALVRVGVLHCCYPCVLAMRDRWSIMGAHSEACERRQVDRRKGREELA